MTTQKQQPQTPYDAEIAKEEENRGSVGYLEYLRGARMGHLLAKAEDADLLAACELVIAHDGRLTGADLAAIHAAIAKAKGGA